MKINRQLLASVFFVAVSVGSANAATVAIDNFNTNSDGGYGIRDSSNILVSGTDFKGVLGTFSISNATIAADFAAGDFSAIQAGFQQFDSTANGTYALDSFGAGLFSASLDNDTKTTSNSLGGSPIYTVFYKGASLATATELLVAQLNSVFPTDPAVGAALLGSASFRPDTITNLVVGTALGSTFDHDYGFGGGALPTYALQTSGGAVPEPSRSLLGMIGLGVLALRRRRR